MKQKTHDDAMAEVYQKDPAYALELLNSVLADGDQAELLVVLRQLAKAFGGVQAINSVMQKSERLQPYIRTLREFSLCLVPDGMCGLAPLASGSTRSASQ